MNEKWLSTSVHALDGRLRIKTSAAKRNPAKARDIEQFLSRGDGVTKVAVNPVTGSILVYYDSERLSVADVLRRLYTSGYIDRQGDSPHGRSSHFDRHYNVLTDVLMRSTMEMAVQSVIRALI